MKVNKAGQEVNTYKRNQDPGPSICFIAGGVKKTDGFHKLCKSLVVGSCKGKTNKKVKRQRFMFEEYSAPQFAYDCLVKRCCIGINPIP